VSHSRTIEARLASQVQLANVSRMYVPLLAKVAITDTIFKRRHSAADHQPRTCTVRTAYAVDA